MRILFIDGSTKLETVHDLASRARGGMVTSLFRVSGYLARRGHDVSVLSDIQFPGITPDGVIWRRGYFRDEPYDCLVMNRGMSDGYPEIQAKARFLWTHDLPHAGFIPDPQAARALACTVFMSAYAEDVWRTFYRTIGESVTIPNGVDKRLFYPREKDPSYLIYASAPNRGLQRLPFIFDAIQAAINRPLKCRAFSSLAKLHPGEGEDRFDYAAIRSSNVELCDPLPQERFAEEIGRAALMILPTDYPEICSNVILQSLASGTPVVTTGGLGSAGEWVSGTLTKFKPYDYMVYAMEIVRLAVDALSKPLTTAKSNILTWDEVGARWERMLSQHC